MMFEMMEEELGEWIKQENSFLRHKYPYGFYIHLSSSSAPKKMRALRRYLGKYLASPPISLGRILSYDGMNVVYCYDDHNTKSRVTEQVTATYFIGRLLQHLRIKGFQKVRYYGLQATATYKKCKEALKIALQKLGVKMQESFQLSFFRKYRERRIAESGKDPFRCPHCGGEMMLWYLWNRDDGVFYNALEAAPEYIPKRSEMVREESQTIQMSYC